MAKKYLRKRGVANRYDASIRWVERAEKDGRLPPPSFYRGRIPFWDEDELDASDRAAAAAPRSKRAVGTTAEQGTEK